jgi:hypothetical protein
MCIYRRDEIFAMLGIYLNNLPLGCSNAEWVVKFKRTPGQRFKLRDLGDLTKLIGAHHT